MFCIVQGYHLVGQQSEGPSVMTCRRLGAAKGQQVRLYASVMFFLLEYGALTPVQGIFKSLFYESFAQLFEVAHGDMVAFAYLGVGQIGTVGVGSKQGKGTLDDGRLFASFSDNCF